MDKITDINDLVLFLASTAMKPLLDDEIWQVYGYDKRPKIGNIWHKMLPKKFALEDFITKEILTLGLIDVLNGIKKTKKSSEEKLLLSLGVMDQFFTTTEHMFASDSFMDNLLSTYASYINSDKSKLHEPLILKSKEILDKKNFAKFMVGTIKLLGISGNNEDYLLKSSYLKDVIENSSLENKLNLSMSEEKYKKYGEILSTHILNA